MVLPLRETVGQFGEFLVFQVEQNGRRLHGLVEVETEPVHATPKVWPCLSADLIISWNNPDLKAARKSRCRSGSARPGAGQDAAMDERRRDRARFEAGV